MIGVADVAASIVAIGKFAIGLYAAGFGCSAAIDGVYNVPVYSAWSQPDCNRFRSWLCSATMCTFMYTYVDLDIDVYMIIDIG